MGRAVLGLLVVLTVCCASDTQSYQEAGHMTSPEDRVARVRSLVEALNSQDVARSVEHLAS
jgi:hypothetical protein